MLSKKHRELVNQGFAQGLTDSAIAKAVPGATAPEVALLRQVWKQAQELPAQPVRKPSSRSTLSRNAIWRQMLQDGASVEAVATMYEVKPKEVRMALWPENQVLIRQGFEKGFPDTMIAAMVPGVVLSDVGEYRKELGISAKTVLHNRYNTWIQMIESGIKLEVIAEIYKVKASSIRLSLHRDTTFSFMKAREKTKSALESQRAKLVEEAKKAILGF